jgi:hypothetical protein
MFSPLTEKPASVAGFCGVGRDGVCIAIWEKYRMQQPHYITATPGTIPASQATIEVILDPLPLPPDFNSRLAQIYAIFLKRYHEHAFEIEQRKKAVLEREEAA